MPGEQETIRLFDLPQNKADAQEMLAIVEQIDNKIKGITGFTLGGKTGDSAQFRQQSEQITSGMTQIAEMQKQLIELENQLQAARSKGGASTKAQTDDQIRASVTLRAENKARVDAIKAEDSAYDQLLIKYKAMAKVAKDLAIEQGAGSQAAKDAATAAKALSDQLGAAEAAVGQNQRKVGAYTEALTPLHEELTKVNAQLKEMEIRGKAAGGVQNLGARNPVGFDPNKNKTTSMQGPGGATSSVLQSEAVDYQKLTVQAQALNTVLNQQEAGFSSVTQRIRASERALQTLRAAGLEAGEGFAEFREQTIEAARDMKEFQRQQKLLESELPALKALTLAAKGLGGAYAIGAGASALFAQGNEKVEKELNKLVAIMTLLQGLNEAWELIQMGGAAATAVKTAAIGAQTFALELYTAIAGAATDATAALDAAMVATGIGALLLALGGLVYLLSKATVSTTALVEAQTKLNEQQKEYYEAVVKTNEALDEELAKTDQAAKNAEAVQAINVRSIADAQALSKAKHAINADDKARGKETLDDLQKQIGAQDDLQGQYDEQLRRVARFQKALRDLQQEKVDRTAAGKNTDEVDSAIKTWEISTKMWESDAAALKTKLDRYKDVNRQIEDAEQAEKLLVAEDEKYAHELYERKIKALVEIVNLNRAQAAEYLAMQGRIAPQESQQINALNAEKALREQIINSNMRQELRAEGLTKEERKLIRAKSAKEIEDLDVQFIGREAQIRYAASLQDIDQENQTTEALLKIREQFYKRQEEQATQANINRKAYEESQRDERLRALDAENAKHPLSGNSNKDAEQLRKYADAREQIETDSNVAILKSDLELAEKQRAIASAKEEELKRAPTPASPEAQQKQLKDIADLEQQKNTLAAKSSNIRLQIEDAEDKNKADKRTRLLAKQKEEEKAAMESAEAVANATQAFIDGAFEKQIERIDRQIKKNQELKEAETSRIQNSTLSETQKAAMLDRLQIETEQKNQALERKKAQEKAKQAEADRDAAVIKILANTYIDASEDGWFTPAAIAAEVMGFAAIAALVAKPIPKFETGTDYSPEGLAVLHPGEMRVDPSGKISMTENSGPSLSFLERGTKIIPKNRTSEMDDMIMAAILSGGGMIEDNRLTGEVRDLKNAIVKGSAEQIAAIKKIKAPNITVIIEAEFLTYIKTCQ